MEPTKAEQYSNLVLFLDKTDFTTSKDIDVLIRDKVANLMINNFIFMQIKGTYKSDLISVPTKQEVATEKLRKEEPKQEIFTTKSKKVQKKSSTGKPMNEALEMDIEKIDDVRSMPTPTKSQSPKISPTKKFGNLSARDFVEAQDHIYDDAGGSDSDLPLDSSESIEEVMKTFPQLSIEEARAAIESERGSDQALVPQKGLTGRGIKRL
jgi:hypothetical protein